MILSERDVYVASHVTQDVKDALRVESEREKSSMSRLVALALRDFLMKRGHQLKEQP